jgi:hypothetical protein
VSSTFNRVFDMIRLTPDNDVVISRRMYYDVFVVGNLAVLRVSDCMRQCCGPVRCAAPSTLSTAASHYRARAPGVFPHVALWSNWQGVQFLSLPLSLFECFDPMGVERVNLYQVAAASRGATPLPVLLMRVPACCTDIPDAGAVLSRLCGRQGRVLLPDVRHGPHWRSREGVSDCWGPRGLLENRVCRCRYLSVSIVSMCVHCYCACCGCVCVCT